MAIFDRFRSKPKAVANSVNGITRGNVRITSPWFAMGQGGRHAEAYRWLVVRMIFDGFRNVHYFVDGESSKAVTRLLDFFHRRYEELLWLFWSYGYIVIGIDQYGRYYIPDYSTLVKDDARMIVGYSLVYYAPEYLFSGRTPFGMIAESMRGIDTYRAADLYLTKTFGAVGVASGKEMPLTSEGRSELEAELESEYGIEEGKKKIIVTKKPVDFKVFSFPVKELELTEKVENELKFIANYFGVPYDLIAYSGASTFANQEQATINFYRNCISPLAEILLSIARYMVKVTRGDITYSENITFRIDNVTELQDDRTADIEYKQKVAALIAKMDAIGEDTTQYRRQLKLQ